MKVCLYIIYEIKLSECMDIFLVQEELNVISFINLSHCCVIL